jgi:hypothetical protein
MARRVAIRIAAQAKDYSSRLGGIKVATEERRIAV